MAKPTHAYGGIFAPGGKYGLLVAYALCGWEAPWPGPGRWWSEAPVEPTCSGCRCKLGLALLGTLSLSSSSSSSSSSNAEHGPPSESSGQ